MKEKNGVLITQLINDFERRAREISSSPEAAYKESYEQMVALLADHLNKMPQIFSPKRDNEPSTSTAIIHAHPYDYHYRLGIFAACIRALNTGYVDQVAVVGDEMNTWREALVEMNSDVCRARASELRENTGDLEATPKTNFQPNLRVVDPSLSSHEQAQQTHSDAVLDMLYRQGFRLDHRHNVFIFGVDNGSKALLRRLLVRFEIGDIQDYPVPVNRRTTGRHIRTRFEKILRRP